MTDDDIIRGRRRQDRRRSTSCRSCASGFAGKKIVQCHGAFDLVHIGHLIHFEEAKAQGDVLVVTITADRFITKKRGVTFPEDYRAQQVAALAIVDYVALVPEPTALSAVERAAARRLREGARVPGPGARQEPQRLSRDAGARDATAAACTSRPARRSRRRRLAHFLLGVVRSGAAQSAAAERSRALPGRRRPRLQARAAEGVPGAGERRCASACIGETIVDEWVDVALTNMSTQSRCVAGLEQARVAPDRRRRHHRAAPGEFRAARCTASRTTSRRPGAEPARPSASRRASSSRRGSSIARRGHPLFKTRRMSARRRCPAEALPDFGDYDLVLVADYGHGLLDAAAVNDSDRRARTRVRRRHGPGQLGQLRLQSADQVPRRRLLQPESDRGRAVPARARAAARRAGRADRRRLLRRPRRVGDRRRSGRGDQGRGRSDSRCRRSASSVGRHHRLRRRVLRARQRAAAASACPRAVVALVGSIGAAAMTQRRCNESPVTEQEFMTIGKIVI